jgi:large subunit ribosomal protein L5
MSRLQDKYNQTAIPALRDEFGYTNIHQVPRVMKIVLNSGFGRQAGEARHLELVSANLGRISGQAAVATVAKKSIAGFKLREGQKIGAMVTLRGDRMYEFLDRLISVVLPRVRDFRGLPRAAFDPQGNYSLGLDDITIFPEMPLDEPGASHGLQINIITNAKTTAEGRRLMELLGLPLQKEASNG